MIGQTYFMDLDVNQVNELKWNPGPNMTKSRTQHSCGVIDFSDGAKVVIVAGGAGDDQLRSTELLWIESNGFIIGSEWLEGPQLPEEHINGQMIQYPDKESLTALGMYNSVVGEDVSTRAYTITCVQGKKYLNTLQE